MISAVDASVMVAVARPEPSAEAWLGLLQICRAEGELVMCDVAAAETFALINDEVRFRRLLTDLGIRFDAVNLAASMLAGRIFRAYRQIGGPRTHLIPDFIIAAHASVQAQCLLSTDRGFTRRYFPRLKLLSP